MAASAKSLSNSFRVTIPQQISRSLERKRHKKHSIEPMNLDTILADTKRTDEVGVDGY